jgi:hypothetical protein
MAKSLLSTLSRQVALGFGRQVGFRSAKQLEKEIAKKVIDPNSKFRKTIQKFQLPGNPKLAIQKMWSLVDGFMEEYETNNSMFQINYKQGDVDFIEKKFDRIVQMNLSDDDTDNLNHLQSVWNNLKTQ